MSQQSAEMQMYSYNRMEIADQLQLARFCNVKVLFQLLKVDTIYQYCKAILDILAKWDSPYNYINNSSCLHIAVFVYSYRSWI